MRCCGRFGGRHARRQGFYRDKGGLLLGVCRGLAGRLGLPVWVVRAFAVLLFLVAGWAVAAGYLVLGLVMRPGPEPGRVTVDDGETLAAAAREVRERARDLEARVGRMESHVTSREFDFDRRLAASGRPGR
ncbi:PspC domain-containing protein [Solidesulfovibrio sp.]|uniref:PspC domain-containing protein n=1 Tax=Solidesulfovibrio sp. TaxID=2910990 RepID=UPI0026329ECA|nr:PspC domain-containing protein [Solidesulfovibrio sp.]